MLYWLNIGYTILFCIEMAAKVVAYGFLFGETAYIKSSWNILDGTNLPRPDLVSGHTRPRPYAPPPPTPQAPSSSCPLPFSSPMRSQLCGSCARSEY